MKILLFAFLFLLGGGAAPTALAAEGTELQCPQNLTSKRHQELISLVTLEAQLYGLDTYVCAMSELWRRGHINDKDFFTQLPLRLKNPDGSSNPYFDLYIYQQADRPDIDETARGAASRNAALIYGNEASPLYNAQNAKHYYLKYHLEKFKRTGVAQSCIDLNQYNTTNPIEKAVLSEISSLCVTPDPEVFSLAEEYEALPNGKMMALNLYKHLRSRFRMGRSSDPQLETKVNAKIGLLSN